MVFIRFIVSVLLLGSLSCHLAYAAPKVVVSIMPIHSLVSQLMEGTDQPTLLLPPDHSPHHFQLKPSDANHLEQADLVVWLGPELETFLGKPLSALASNTTVITLMDIPNLRILTMTHPHHHGHEQHTHHHSNRDPHLWLDPQNTLKIIPVLTQALSKLDPDHALLYATNAKKLKKVITDLDHDLQSYFNHVTDAPFLVYHDGYQYLITRYSLNGLGPITDHPHVPLSLNKIKSIREKIKTQNVVCVFSEPEINPNIMAQLVANSTARQSILDPLGFDLKPGPSAYEAMMRSLGQNITECLRKH